MNTRTRWPGVKITSVSATTSPAKTAAVPYPTQADGDISQDGHGGIWMYATGPPGPGRAPFYLYHYAHGQWSRQAAPALGGQATEMGVLSWRPGRKVGVSRSRHRDRGLLLRYFPHRTAISRMPRLAEAGKQGSGKGPARTALQGSPTAASASAGAGQTLNGRGISYRMSPGS